MTGDIPDAWPLLLTRELACAYLQISAESFARICPIPSVDLGLRVLRWNRLQLDTWVAGLPARLPRAQAEAQDGEAGLFVPAQPADERRDGAIARALERSQCRTSRSSSASHAQTAA
jgi:hypothetical protein